MSLLSWLTGSVFYDLWQHGREIEPLIARKDERVLSRSTPELERHFDETAVEQPRQNGFPVAFVMLLLLVAFALNLLSLLRLLPGLTPPLHALAFFLRLRWWCWRQPLAACLCWRAALAPGLPVLRISLAAYCWSPWRSW